MEPALRRAAAKPIRDTLKEWLPSRRGAMSRLLAVPEIDPGDVAEAAGYARDAADMLLAAFGAAPWRESDGDVADPPHLRARLRAHIGRQIAVLDAALSAPERPGLDSAKVLRDLGGLKRLLDDLDSMGQGRARSMTSRPAPTIPPASATRRPPRGDRAAL